MILGVRKNQFGGGGMCYGAGNGEHLSSCSNSSNGGDRQAQVGEVVGGKGVLRGSDFSPPLFSL